MPVPAAVAFVLVTLMSCALSPRVSGCVLVQLKGAPDMRTKVPFESLPP